MKYRNEVAAWLVFRVIHKRVQCEGVVIIVVFVNCIFCCSCSCSLFS